MVKNLRENEIFYTFPLISNGTIIEIVFSTVQFNILKLVSQKSKIKPMAESIGCEPPNIRYHLKKLSEINLVENVGGKFSSVWRITKEGKQVLKGGKRRKVVVKKGVVKKGCIDSKRQRKNNLTKRQARVYSLIVDEDKTQECVAIMLNTTQQNVSKHYKKALDKLHIVGGNKKEVVKGMSPQPVSPQKPMRFRGHNFRWTIRILKKYDGFKTGSETFGNCLIKIWEDKIQIISQDDFLGDSAEDSFFTGLVYFHKIFLEIEKIFKVKICKKGELNKNLYQCDVANIHNEIAKVQIEEGNKFYIRDKDGVAWAVIDNSFKLFEFETIHAKTVLPSMENCQKHLNDWRDNPDALTNSELTNMIKYIVVSSNSNNEQMKQLTMLMETLTREVRGIKDGHGVKSW
jgi:DNA-binding MarR family transcriptional regulator